MPENIDHAQALANLNRAWKEIECESKAPPRMAKLIEIVLGAPDVTFKYLLVTGFLAKSVNRAAHARSIQASSTLPGAFDARSLCHGVVVGFEKSKGNLFGLSNEPYVNKPARHPEHDGENPQIRNIVLSRKLHEVLEIAQTSSPEEVFSGLVHILRVGAKRAAEEKSAAIAHEVNLAKVIAFVREFLKDSDGGSRLVAIWGAFTSLLTESAEVKVYSPNASDYFSKTSGDVEVFYEQTLATASECKQRPLSLDDVNHGIKKATQNGCPEYLFVYSDGLVEGQGASIAKSIRNSSAHVDVALIDIRTQAPILAKALNPKRRAIFGETVVTLLREMRKYETANAAAELWNTIKN